MGSWLINISLAITVVIALTQLMNELDRLLRATERLARHLGNVLRGPWRAIGSPGRRLARRMAIFVVTALLIALMWPPWPR
jgi:hypothetical protein